MSGYPPFDGLAVTAAALIVILSAIVSLLGSGARRRAVELGQATTLDLCELTGITDPTQLQDVFGPPDMGRVWRSVTLQDILRERRPLGHLISNDAIDWAGIAVATVSFFWRPPLIELLLIVCVALQVASWVAASRLPR
jgi:hypothetical protein